MKIKGAQTCSQCEPLLRLKKPAASRDKPSAVLSIVLIGKQNWYLDSPFVM